MLDERLIWPISLPAFYLENSTDNTISVESYYFDKHTNQDKLWERQDILPGETKQVMDWVYPTRLCVYIDDCLVSDYVGSNDKLNKDELEAGQLRKVSTGENLEKVEWCDIPSDKYDFGWLPIRENSPLFGRRRYNLVFGE